MRTRRKTITYEVEEGILDKRGWRVLRVLTYRQSPIRGGKWMTTRIKSRAVRQAPVKRHHMLVMSHENLYKKHFTA